MAEQINQIFFEKYNRSNGVLPLLFIPKCPKIIDVGPNCETMLVDVSMNVNEYGVDLNGYRKGKCLYSGFILFKEGDVTCDDSTCRCNNTTPQGTSTREILDNVNPDSLPELVTNDDPLISDLIFEENDAFVSFSVMEQEKIKPEIKEAVISNQETGDIILESCTYESEEESESDEYGFQYLYEDYTNDGANVNVANEHSIEEQSSDNAALKQLLSKDIKSAKKQQKTILLEKSGQTVHKVTMEKTSSEIGENTRENDVICEETNCVDPNFEINTSNTFKEETTYNCIKSDSTGRLSFICKRCGKKLKNKEKYEQHSLAHGNPNLECNQCHKVYASKYSLRNHMKIHSRRYKCDQCTKSFSDRKSFTKHIAKLHFRHVCRHCSFQADSIIELKAHVKNDHWYLYDRPEALADDSPSLMPSMDSNEEVSSNNNDDDENHTNEEAVSHDSVIAGAISDGVFQTRRKKYYRDKICSKKCGVCQKVFDRIGDLKRHLIEHIIKSTLAKTPVGEDGALELLCVVCRSQVFNKVDKYKAHLREHAHVTLYKCSFCDKSFSDSSNFSKHKKVHGNNYLQCELCKRKFNSKKMIMQHMEYHNKNEPKICQYCNKICYFESSLKKHIKSMHSKQIPPKFKCRFCPQTNQSLKQKWDHEWLNHKARKLKIDCTLCGAKYRKYSLLKKHCIAVHHVELPLAKKYQNCF